MVPSSSPQQTHFGLLPSSSSLSVENPCSRDVLYPSGQDLGSPPTQQRRVSALGYLPIEDDDGIDFDVFEAASATAATFSQIKGQDKASPIFDSRMQDEERQRLVEDKMRLRTHIDTLHSAKLLLEDSCSKLQEEVKEAKAENSSLNNIHSRMEEKFLKEIERLQVANRLLNESSQDFQEQLLVAKAARESLENDKSQMQEKHLREVASLKQENERLAKTLEISSNVLQHARNKSPSDREILRSTMDAL